LPHSATLLPLLLRTSVAHRDLSSFPTRRSASSSVVWITESSSVTFIPRFHHVARSGRSHRDFLLETAHRGTPESGRGRIVGGQQRVRGSFPGEPTRVFPGTCGQLGLSARP